MRIFCRLWECFADYVNILQILGHRGGATLLGLDSMWLSCSALVLFIIIIIIIIIVILISNCAHHGHLYCFTCSSQTTIKMQGCVDQRSTCDQQHSGKKEEKFRITQIEQIYNKIPDRAPLMLCISSPGFGELSLDFFHFWCKPNEHVKMVG